ncbi:hypothetical protein C2S52_012583 [Perilla frutescens var. hirtella]|nr:hypothetical protein C2S52_012583 [Perilla frutescens var. hirtella]
MGNIAEEEKQQIPLLTPYKLGDFQLSHRIVLAPLTRQRSYDYIPQQHAVLYYSQRATKGGLLLTKGTGVSDTAQGSCFNYLLTRSSAYEASCILPGFEQTSKLRHFQPNGEAPISSTDRGLTPLILPDGAVAARFSPPRRLRTEEIPLLTPYKERNCFVFGF